MNSLLPVLAWSSLVLGAPARVDELPADPDKAIEKIAKEVNEIHKRAQKTIQARQKKLLAHLRARHTALVKAGKNKEAGAIQDRIVLVEASLAKGRPLTDVAGTLKKASVRGKYKGLLRVLHIPQDAASAAFQDFGMWNGTNYAGYTKLPAGYWVYHSPCWYIWRDLGP
jgi:hypothetical protein